MLVSQIVGTEMGCIISPCVFWLFDIDNPGFETPDSEYQVLYALVYRNVYLLGMQRFSCQRVVPSFALHSLQELLLLGAEKGLCLHSFSMAMAIPFYLGLYFAVDMKFESLLWMKSNKAQPEASGLICSDGIWTLPNGTYLHEVPVKKPKCQG
ncbi:LOW QUALITY PROTEIN: hypothetical protein RJ641_004357 [Dillenia turbinata]|uniref:Uncharacterized protein n=1 Tax=Dillenia turbinata TaxID=194707 RepID=A0AAN8V8D1_9MAGN